VRESSSNRPYSFIVIFFILTLAFSLTSAGTLSTNTSIGIDAYAKKPNESSGGSSQGSSSDSSDKSGGTSSGSDTESSSDNSNKEGNKNSDQGTNNNEQQQQEPDSNDGSNTAADNSLQAVEPPKIGKGGQGSEPFVPPVDTTTPSPPPTTCEQGSICTDDQHDSNSHDHSIATTTKDNTPFVLSLPFP
jgi:hypothetical protein